jgi:inner membrane protein
MDNLTHTLTGAVLARAGLRDATPGATAALLLASNLPDVDLVTWLAGSASYLHHHRDLSHGLLVGPLLALGLAAALRVGVRGARLLPLLGLSLLGVLGHIFMDLWTSYGTRALSPFDRTWYAWDTVFIVDPVILVLLAGALLVRAASARRRVASVAVGLVLAYAGARALLHDQALVMARERLPREGLVRVAAIPHPLDPLRWRILADAGRAFFVGELRLAGASPPFERRDKLPEDPAVALAREHSEIAAIFLDFSSFPWLEVEQVPEGTAVTWRDLRFERPGRESFVTRIVVAPDGRIRSQAFRF